MSICNTIYNITKPTYKRHIIIPKQRTENKTNNIT